MASWKRRDVLRHRPHACPSFTCAIGRGHLGDGHDNRMRSAMKEGSSVYDGPIIDAYTHLWDLSMGCHGWLTQADGVSALGGLETLRRDVVVETFRHDCANQPIVASVHIEALWIRPIQWGRCVGRGPAGHAARSRNSGAAGCVRACGRHPPGPQLPYLPTARNPSRRPATSRSIQRGSATWRVLLRLDCCWR